MATPASASPPAAGSKSATPPLAPGSTTSPPGAGSESATPPPAPGSTTSPPAAGSESVFTQLYPTANTNVHADDYFVVMHSNTQASPRSPSLTRIKRRKIMQLCKTGHKKPRKNPLEYAQKKVATLSKKEISNITSQQILTDKHISAANELLKRQFPETRGLQPTFLGQNLTFQVVKPPFVQVLHVGNNHWDDSDWYRPNTGKSLR